MGALYQIAEKRVRNVCEMEREGVKKVGGKAILSPRPREGGLFRGECIILPSALQINARPESL